MLTTQKILSLICCILLFFGDIQHVWSRSVEKQAVLTVLTLNIARFSHWPASVFEKTDPVLNFCIIGDNIVQQSFENLNNKVVNQKRITIINLSRLRNLAQCQLLYISDLERIKLTSLLAELKGQPILTVGESLAFLAAGGMVALNKVDGKMQLNIHLSIVKQSGLVISSRLLKLANIVDFSN